MPEKLFPSSPEEQGLSSKAREAPSERADERDLQCLEKGESVNADRYPSESAMEQLPSEKPPEGRPSPETKRKFLETQKSKYAWADWGALMEDNESGTRPDAMSTGSGDRQKLPIPTRSVGSGPDPPKILAPKAGTQAVQVQSSACITENPAQFTAQFRVNDRILLADHLNGLF